MPSTTAPEFTENRTFEEIRVGDLARLTHRLTEQDLRLFAAMAGDANIVPPGAGYSRASVLPESTAQEMWSSAMLAAVIGADFPGPGTVLLRQDLRFLKPVPVGASVDVTVTVTARDEATREVTLECRCVRQDGVATMSGTVTVLAPSEKIRLQRLAPLPAGPLTRNQRYELLLSMVAKLPAITVAVVHPCSPEALLGAVEAAHMGLIVPILIGPEAKIRAVAAEASVDLTPYRIVATAHSNAAAEAAVAMARRGEVAAIMKGSLHTDELMHEVLKSEGGLRTDRRASHCFLLDVPSYPKPLLITDGAINVEPDLDAKRDIVQNAIELIRAIGVRRPKVAILAAVETVNAKMRSTLDAAALCKMADRGQITGAVVDGPLAFDNAISPVAAREKGIVSPVAGYADVLIAPDLEAANMLAKQLQYLADAQSAGIVMGTRVPIILTSRAEGSMARIGSCALAQLVCQQRLAKPAAEAVAAAQPMP